MNKHEFALFFPDLIALGVGDEITIIDHDLVHRMHTVLRMKVGQSCILFNARRAYAITIISLSKKELEALVDERIESSPLKPSIRFLLPLLKREALEEALYSLVELGANEIQLVATHKSLHEVQPKYMERLHKIIIAAAEQSKHFTIPALLDPIPLARIFNDDVLVFFDPEGEQAFSIIEDMRRLKPHRFNLLIGPEGDLTHDEKKLLKEHGALFCQLTPTILRARSAVVAGLALFRSLLQ